MRNGKGEERKRNHRNRLSHTEHLKMNIYYFCRQFFIPKPLHQTHANKVWKAKISHEQLVMQTRRLYCSLNRVWFDLKPPRRDTLMEEIKTLSHHWITHRSKNIRLNWLEWINTPSVACTV